MVQKLMQYFEKNYFIAFFRTAFLGTFAPLSLASDKPIAIACFGSVTFFPLRPL